jgi:hypothetical protein
MGNEISDFLAVHHAFKSRFDTAGKRAPGAIVGDP